MQYNAYFLINGGESQGFGLKSPAKYNEEKTFESTESDAYFEAMYQARLLAEDAFSNPDTNKTVVTLLELYGPNGKIELADKKVIAECSQAEHLLNCHFTKEEYYRIMNYTKEAKKIKDENKNFKTLESFLKK